MQTSKCYFCQCQQTCHTIRPAHPAPSWPSIPPTTRVTYTEPLTDTFLHSSLHTVPHVPVKFELCSLSHVQTTAPCHTYRRQPPVTRTDHSPLPHVQTSPLSHVHTTAPCHTYRRQPPVTRTDDSPLSHVQTTGPLSHVQTTAPCHTYR